MASWAPLDRRALIEPPLLAALGLALFFHGLFAWSWLRLTPALPMVSSGSGGVLSIAVLSPEGRERPLQKDRIAEQSRRDRPHKAVAAKPVSRPSSSAVVRPKKPAKRAVVKRQRVVKARSRPQAATRPTAETRRLPATPQGDPSVHQAQKQAPPTHAATTGGGREDAAAGSAAGADRAAAPMPGNARPRYPRLARRRGQQGRVVIRVSVRGDGRVGSVEVARSSGHGVLDQAALRAVKHWRFEPALRAGRPVATTLTVPVIFRLEG